jgi:hypothetical protein
VGEAALAVIVVEDGVQITSEEGVTMLGRDSFLSLSFVDRHAGCVSGNGSYVGRRATSLTVVEAREASTAADGVGEGLAGLAKAWAKSKGNVGLAEVVVAPGRVSSSSMKAILRSWAVARSAAGEAAAATTSVGSCSKGDGEVRLIGDVSLGGETIIFLLTL